jgi:hypothetical protein
VLVEVVPPGHGIRKWRNAGEARPSHGEADDSSTLITIERCHTGTKTDGIDNRELTLPDVQDIVGWALALFLPEHDHARSIADGPRASTFNFCDSVFSVQGNLARSHSTKPTTQTPDINSKMYFDLSVQGLGQIPLILSDLHHHHGLCATWQDKTAAHRSCSIEPIKARRPQARPPQDLAMRHKKQKSPRHGLRHEPDVKTSSSLRIFRSNDTQFMRRPRTGTLDLAATQQILNSPWPLAHYPPKILQPRLQSPLSPHTLSLLQTLDLHDHIPQH